MHHFLETSRTQATQKLGRALKRLGRIAEQAGGCIQDMSMATDYDSAQDAASLARTDLDRCLSDCAFLIGQIRDAQTSLTAIVDMPYPRD